MSVKINEMGDKAKSFLVRYRFYLLLASILLTFVTLLVDVKRFDIIPATFFSAITAIFSYWAYRFSKEKFRLDLFDKRWTIYEHVLEFCSRVTQQGSLKIGDDNQETILAALKAAENSFRGIGWHKTQALFGDDIHAQFEQLNNSYAWLSACSDDPPDDPQQRMQWAQEKEDHPRLIWGAVVKLPEVYRPYVYFGDYKRDQ